MLCCRLTPPASRRGQPMSSLAEYALRTHPAPSSLFLGTGGLCCRFVLTTLARLPSGLAWAGNGRHRLSSGLLVHLTLARTRILFHFPLLFGSLYCNHLYLGSLESLLYIYVLLGSIVNYCDVTICDQIHPHCVHVFKCM